MASKRMLSTREWCNNFVKTYQPRIRYAYHYAVQNTYGETASELTLTERAFATYMGPSEDMKKRSTKVDWQ